MSENDKASGMVLSPGTEAALKRVLHYSYDEIQWDYHRLTSREKELISAEELAELHAYASEAPEPLGLTEQLMDDFIALQVKTILDNSYHIGPDCKRLLRKVDTRIDDFFGPDWDRHKLPAYERLVVQASFRDANEGLT